MRFNNHIIYSFLLIFCVFPIFQSHADLKNGLVGWWKLDETSGVTAYDSSGNGNNGTLTNGPIQLAGCKRGNCVSFDGADDHINMGNVLNFTTGDITIAFWIKTPDVDAFQALVGKRNSSSPYQQYAVIQGTMLSDGNVTNSKKISMLFYNGNGFNNANTNGFYSTNDIIDGNWHHIVIMRSNNVGVLYVDGISKGVTVVYSAADVNVTNTASFRLGNNNASVYFQGSLDDVRVYNRALTAQEAADLYRPGIMLRNGVVRNANVNQ